MTLEGALIGTITYMAPEQARGDLEAIGPPTDVWALGVVLYELLAGVPPFEAPTQLEALQKTLTERPPSPAWVRPEVPRALETIVARCLEREPKDRYPSAAALADDLAAFLRGDAAAVRRASSARRLPRAAVRPPLKAPSRPRPRCDGRGHPSWALRTSWANRPPLSTRAA